jgi:hypothetical protein
MGASLAPVNPFDTGKSVFGGTGGPTEDAVLILEEVLSLLIVEETELCAE